MFYYYIDFDYMGKETKKGPYTIAELQTLNLPVETLIWSDGWDENKPISECPEVMDFFTLNPPALPTDPQTTGEAAFMPQVAEATEEAEMVEVHPDMHWLPSTLLYLGILGGIIRTITECVQADSGAAMALIAIIGLWGVVSIGGMIALKKWALISYFAYRFSMCLMLIWMVNTGLDNGDDFVKDIFSLILVLGLFLLKKDGHNVYELLWNNGVFYVKKEKPVEEEKEEKEENVTTDTETSEENQ